MQEFTLRLEDSVKETMNLRSISMNNNRNMQDDNFNFLIKK